MNRKAIAAVAILLAFICLLLCCKKGFDTDDANLEPIENTENDFENETEVEEGDNLKETDEPVVAESSHVHDYVNCFCSCGAYIETDEDDKTVILNSERLHSLGLDNTAYVEIPETMDVDGEEYTIVGINNLKIYGAGVFENNTIVEEIVLPDTIVYIGDFTFDKCTNLKRITMPDGLKYIGKAAFQHCYSLEWISIPDTVEYIGNFAYNHCSGAENETIILPSSLKQIGDYINYPAHAFYNCGLDGVFNSFVISEDNQYYKTEDGILYTKDGATLISIPRSKEFENNAYIMPDTITNLGELSFSRNTNITTVVISDNLTVDGELNEYEKMSYKNYGNDLSVACYGYAPVNKYEVKETNENYRAVDGILYSKDGSQVVAIPNNYIGEIIIPEGTTEWTSDALWGTAIEYFEGISLNKITGISIPSTMEEIASDQIEGMNLLVDLYGTKISVDSENKNFYIDEDGHLNQIG